MIPTFIVNMDTATDRFAAISEHLSFYKTLDVRRVRAAAGSTLAQVVCDILTKTQNYHVGKGALGCFLSHLRIWEFVSELDSRFVLVLGDDARLRRAEILDNLTLPEDAELVFCQSQLEPVNSKPNDEYSS